MSIALVTNVVLILTQNLPRLAKNIAIGDCRDPKWELSNEGPVQYIQGYRKTVSWRFWRQKSSAETEVGRLFLSDNLRRALSYRVTSLVHQSSFSIICDNKRQQKQVRPSLGTDVYPHMPILRPHHTPRDFTNGASLGWRLRRRISTVMFTSLWAWPARWSICSILGFWGSKVRKNVGFPAWDADEPPCKIQRR